MDHLCQWYGHSLRSALRSDLVVQRTRLVLRKRAFAVAAQSSWNSLPNSIRSFYIQELPEDTPTDK